MDLGEIVVPLSWSWTRHEHPFRGERWRRTGRRRRFRGWRLRWRNISGVLKTVGARVSLGVKVTVLPPTSLVILQAYLEAKSRDVRVQNLKVKKNKFPTLKMCTLLSWDLI